MGGGASKCSPEEVARAFTYFDADQNGTLCEEEVVRILAHPGGGAPFTEAEARKLVRKFDKNGDGVLDYREYTQAHKEIRRKSTVGRPSLPAAAAPSAAAPSAAAPSANAPSSAAPSAAGGDGTSESQQSSQLKRKKSVKKPQGMTKNQHMAKTKMARDRQLAQQRKERAEALRADIQDWFGRCDLDVRIAPRSNLGRRPPCNCPGDGLACRRSAEKRQAVPGGAEAAAGVPVAWSRAGRQDD